MTDERERIGARLAAATRELAAAIEEWREQLAPTDDEIEKASQSVYDQYADMKINEHAGSYDWDANVLEAVEDMRKGGEGEDEGEEARRTR